MKIGFIGLGIMGRPMAMNLVRAGHALTVYDINSDNLHEIVSMGAQDASSCKAVAEQVGLIITMLPNSPHVRAAILGKDGVLEGARPGTIIVDMSSIAPSASQEVEQACAEKGVKMIDAPVSGGEPKAVDGTLAIMVGGDKAVFEQIRDSVLLRVGATAVYCGSIGAGNTTKLANQVIVACNIAACAEAFTFAKKAGVDPHMVFEAIQGGLAGSAVMNAKVPMMMESNFLPGFKLDLHIEDLNNALDAGHTIGSPLPLSMMVMDMMRSLFEDGRGGEDHSTLANYYAKVSGTHIA